MYLGLSSIADDLRSVLFITGVGYLEDVKVLDPEIGVPFLLVKIAALQGKTSNVIKTHITASVPRHQEVLIRFRLAGLQHVVQDQNGKKTKEQEQPAVKSKLIGID